MEKNKVPFTLTLNLIIAFLIPVEYHLNSVSSLKTGKLPNKMNLSIHQWKANKISCVNVISEAKKSVSRISIILKHYIHSGL